MSSWQPIETAPRDGTIVLLASSTMVGAGAWAPDLHGDTYPWAFVDDFSTCELTSGYPGIAPNAWALNDGPSHWMPIPAPPESTPA